MPAPSSAYPQLDDNSGLLYHFSFLADMEFRIVQRKENFTAGRLMQGLTYAHEKLKCEICMGFDSREHLFMLNVFFNGATQIHPDFFGGDVWPLHLINKKFSVYPEIISRWDSPVEFQELLRQSAHIIKTTLPSLMASQLEDH